ncbi:MAG: DUF4340 domain-containing protein [Oscillospiraceae bacterium]|nr:DUF4340 domain-containing protein [Oscillospiraceae bacterium]
MAVKKKSKNKLLKILVPVLVVALIAAALVVVLNLPDSQDDTTAVDPTKTAKFDATVDKDNLHQAEPEVNADGEVSENGTGDLLSYIPRNIKTIEVENTKSKYKIKSYTPVKKTTDENGEEKEETQATEYTLVGYEKYAIADGTPDAIANDAASLSFIKIVSTDGTQDKDFGFDSPRATVKITYTDKTSAKIIVGGDAPTDAGVYVKFGTKDYIYLVESDAVDTFLYGINDLMSLVVTKSADSGDNASPTLVRLSGTNFKETVEFVPSDDETASTNYLIKKPSSYYGSDSGCSEVEAGIRGIQANSVVYVNPGEAQLNKYGLKTPFAELYAEYPDTTVSLKASKPDKKGYCYLMKSGGKVVYRILSDSIKWTQHTLNDLRTKYFVDNQMSSLSKTEVNFGSKSYTFTLATQKSDNDQSATVTTVKYNGKEISRGAFQTAFDFTHGENFLRHGFTNEAISGSPKMTIRYTYNSDRSQDEMKFYDMGNQKYYITVNGKQISYVYKNAVVDLQRLFTSATKSSPADDNV